MAREGHKREDEMIDEQLGRKFEREWEESLKKEAMACDVGDDQCAVRLREIETRKLILEDAQGTKGYTENFETIPATTFPPPEYYALKTADVASLITDSNFVQEWPLAA